MFGCLRRVGCLFVFLIAAVAAFLTRDRWLPLLGIDTRPRTEAGGPEWQPVSDEAAARARRAIESLGRSNGPAFVNLPPGDLASYFYIALAQQLPPSADSVEAAVVGNRMYVRAVIALDDFKAVDALGPLAGMIGSRERFQMGGVFEMIRPGLAQYLVEEMKIGQLPIPRGAIPKVLGQIRRGTRPEGVADNGLPFVVPPYLADARIANEQITLYKTTK